MGIICQSKNKIKTKQTATNWTKYETFSYFVQLDKTNCEDFMQKLFSMLSHTTAAGLLISRFVFLVISIKSNYYWQQMIRLYQQGHGRCCSLFSANFVSFMTVAKLWYHKTIILDEQLNLFFLHSTVQQILKDLHTSVWAFLSATALICSLSGLNKIGPMCLNAFVIGGIFSE